MGAAECVLLGMMAFDRHMAICNPPRYPEVMSKAAYAPMAASSWAAGSTTVMMQTSLAMQLPFCGDNVINNFTCEILAVLKLACADISINIISMVLANVIFLGIPVLFIFFSYVFIIATILKIPSAERRKKTFCTCSAHQTAVVIFYRTILFMYGKPKSKDPLGGRQTGPCRQAHLPLLWSGDPLAQPHHLQPEEQGGEGRCEGPGDSETLHPVMLEGS
ncbi:hypothetical protein EI555_005072 [Monodon monoceros]|uniref:G-protein coupled receptors family 1 profile domain-containing protein n=1 Tax=Monodon monoceros TaxID=40151 RepID=A0A4U1FDZ6_MONMO|nr:hypothetical protein EI555_005072 [Monodon monoceros]